MGRSVLKERFSLQVRLLHFSGISLKGKDSMWYNLYSYAIMGSIFSAGILAMQDYVTNGDNINANIENLVFGCSCLIAFVKITTIYMLRKKLGKAMLLLDNKVFVPNTARGGEEEEKLISECMVYANGQGLLLAIMTFIDNLRPNVQTALLRYTHSNNSSYWILPFGDVSILKNTQPPVYEMAWIFQSFATFMTCIGYSATNVYTAAVMAFLSAQCRVLQNSIKMSVKRSYSGITKKVDDKGENTHLETTELHWKHLQKALREIVQYHMLVTDTTNEFENLFYFPILLDFLGASLLICLALFQLTLLPGLNYLFLQLVVLTLGEIALQLMTSYWGNELSLQYMAIGNACTEVDYPGTDIRFQKGLCLIIQRTQKPVHFTVGKFAPLTLNTFISVMRAAYSFCMLLHNMDI